MGFFWDSGDVLVINIKLMMFMFKYIFVKEKGMCERKLVYNFMWRW